MHDLMENNNAVGTAVGTAPRSRAMDMMISRQAQEVQAAMVIAKKFPRDEFSAIERIKRSCQRYSLASQAIYSYPRGKDENGKKQIVSGPSIRLAEVIAQQWGNIDCGVIELEKNAGSDDGYGSSEMMAYCWDLETNTRVCKIFSVDHKRDTRYGTKNLTDSRDVYETTANFGSRRMRACILSVIPGDVVEEALNVCKKTIAQNDQRSFQDRMNDMLKTFKKEFSVTKEQIEKYSGLNLAEFGNDEIIDLQGVYKSLKDGQAKVSDYFDTDYEKEVENPFNGKGENNGTDGK